MAGPAMWKHAHPLRPAGNTLALLALIALVAWFAPSCGAGKSPQMAQESQAGGGAAPVGASTGGTKVATSYAPPSAKKMSANGPSTMGASADDASYDMAVTGEMAPPEPMATTESEALSEPSPSMLSPLADGDGGGGLSKSDALDQDTPAPEAKDRVEQPAVPDPVKITPKDPEPKPQRQCRPDELQPKELFLSADDSNSQASAAVAEQLIRSGRFVPGDAVRTYEFLNYYDMGYANGDDLQVVAHARAVPDRQRAWTLQIGAIAPRMAIADRRAMNLTLVLDTSGSMAGRGMTNLHATVTALAANLRAGDVVSVVTFSVQHQVLLRGHEVRGPNDPAVLDLLTELTPSDRTNLQSALTAAYELTSKHRTRDRLSRVVLISDGNTNTGQQAVDAIAAEAEHAEEGAIFLVGVAVGDAYGLNYQLMDRLTDAGKGAFLYVDSEAEAQRAFGEDFLANMEVAAEDVRAKMVLPPGFRVEEFHGEQISTVASEVVPQHLAPNDAMIYHQVITSCLEATGKEPFVFEAEFTDPATRERRVVRTTTTLDAILGDAPQILKGDALVAYAESLKEVDELRHGDLPGASKSCEAARAEVSAAATALGDHQLRAVEKSLSRYCPTLETGEVINGVCDCQGEAGVGSSLGLCASEDVSGEAAITLPIGQAGTVGIVSQLLDAGPTLAPREGCTMLALSTGIVGERDTVSSRDFQRSSGDPIPEYIGNQRSHADGAAINDLSQVTLTLRAPEWAKSFSFDFLYLSAEYPNYVGSAYNDTFYAIIRAGSTHDGAPTNISFDGSGRSIEVNNNYFQNEYHPCYERGSGFDSPQGGGSTCWLQTSWPIQGGESFTLTFSIHDEGDGVYASEVLLDNFQWHAHEAVGATDPIN